MSETRRFIKLNSKDFRGPTSFLGWGGFREMMNPKPRNLILARAIKQALKKISYERRVA